MLFILSQGWDTGKILSPMRNRTSDIQILHSNALPLSLRDSMASKIHYEVHGLVCTLA